MYRKTSGRGPSTQTKNHRVPRNRRASATNTAHFAILKGTGDCVLENATLSSLLTASHLVLGFSTAFLARRAVPAPAEGAVNV
jgi:hypothetical protein